MRLHAHVSEARRQSVWWSSNSSYRPRHLRAGFGRRGSSEDGPRSLPGRLSLERSAVRVRVRTQPVRRDLRNDRDARADRARRFARLDHRILAAGFRGIQAHSPRALTLLIFSAVEGPTAKEWPKIRAV